MSAAYGNTYIHHSVARRCLHEDAIGRCDDLGVETGSVMHEMFFCIVLELLSVDCVVWTRHGCREAVDEKRTIL
jgi:hypothetical protein